VNHAIQQKEQVNKTINISKFCSSFCLIPIFHKPKSGTNATKTGIFKDLWLQLTNTHLPPSFPSGACHCCSSFAAGKRPQSNGSACSV
jgi:hypothetical protein